MTCNCNNGPQWQCFIVQLCGARGGGQAAVRALYWVANKNLSLMLVLESERERNAAILLARRFARDQNVSSGLRPLVQIFFIAVIGFWMVSDLISWYGLDKTLCLRWSHESIFFLFKKSIWVEALCFVIMLQVALLGPDDAISANHSWLCKTRSVLKLAGHPLAIIPFPGGLMIQFSSNNISHLIWYSISC